MPNKPAIRAEEMQSHIFQAALNSSVAAVAFADLEGRLTYVNPAFLSMWGYHQAEEVLGRRVLELWAYSEKAPEILEALKRQSAWHGEFEARRKDSTTFYVHLSAGLVHDCHGQPALMMGSLVDVTSKTILHEALRQAHDELERRIIERTAELLRINEELRVEITQRLQAEWALQESEALSRAMIDSSPVGVSMRSPTGRLLRYNAAWQRIWAMSEADVQRDLDTERTALRFDDKDAYLGPWQERIRNVYENGGALFVPEVRTPAARPGQSAWVSQYFYALTNPAAQVTGVVIMTLDISDRKQAEEQARIANRTKNEFLTNMSHELRTPLHAILGFAEILSLHQAGRLNQRQQQYADHIVASGKHLLQLINDILDLSKVEAGKMKLETSWVGLGALFNQSLIVIREKAAVHRIRLKLEIAPQTRLSACRADERKMKQILYNLLSNALKFTPDGGAITLSAEIRADELHVAVADTGLGIDPADQQRIFEAFEQVDSSLARGQQGSGLGLALTRRMVELHGGRLWVESEGRGAGSTFYFTIQTEFRAVGEVEPAAEKYSTGANNGA